MQALDKLCPRVQWLSLIDTLEEAISNVVGCVISTDSALECTRTAASASRAMYQQRLEAKEYRLGLCVVPGHLVRN